MTENINPPVTFNNVCKIKFERDLCDVLINTSSYDPATITNVFPHTPHTHNNGLICTFNAPASTSFAPNVRNIHLKRLNITTEVAFSNETTGRNRGFLAGKIYNPRWIESDANDICQYINESVGQPLVKCVEKFYRSVPRSHTGSHSETRKATGQIKLIFNTNIQNTLPDHIIIRGIKYKVTPFIAMPRGCNKCLQFGHLIANCKQEHFTCKDCGLVVPLDAQRTEREKKLVLQVHVHQTPAVCINCEVNGLRPVDHSPFSGCCPVKRRKFMEVEKKVTEALRVPNGVQQTATKKRILSDRSDSEDSSKSGVNGPIPIPSTSAASDHGYTTTPIIIPEIQPIDVDSDEPILIPATQTAEVVLRRTANNANKKKRTEERPNKYPIIPLKAYDNFQNPLTHHANFPPPSEIQRKTYIAKNKHTSSNTDYNLSVSPHNLPEAVKKDPKAGLTHLLKMDDALFYIARLSAEGQQRLSSLNKRTNYYWYTCNKYLIALPEKFTPYIVPLPKVIITSVNLSLFSSLPNDQPNVMLQSNTPNTSTAME